MNMRYIVTLLALMGLSFQANANQPGDAVLEAGKAIFTEVERQVIREVLGRVGLPTDQSSTKDDDDDHDDDYKKDKKHKGKNKGLPPGLAKKGQLPPGLAKRDTLPPGLAKRGLPAEVTSRLPPPPPGTERIIIDTSVLLVEIGTQIVLDVIEDVIRN